MILVSPMPDVEAVAAEILRDADVCEGRIYSSIPRAPTFPLAIVARLGGIPAVRRRLDAARIQVSVWGNNKAEARDAADLARIALHEAEGTTSAVYEAYVTGVEDELGLTWLPDQETARDRYLFAVTVYCHHAEGLTT